jgi:hypothetical protein
MSDPQIPTLATRISSSPGPGWGMGASSMAMLPGFFSIAAVFRSIVSIIYLSFWPRRHFVKPSPQTNIVPTAAHTHISFASEMGFVHASGKRAWAWGSLRVIVG